MLGLGLSVYKSKISSTGGGSGPGSGYTPPLDSITSAVSYSVRKLSSTYTGDCMLVRRVSDGATQDIGFDSDGLIDVAALTSFRQTTHTYLPFMTAVLLLRVQAASLAFVSFVWL
jgi:hypothetical protein